jgi:hypothetical protein
MLRHLVVGHDVFEDDDVVLQVCLLLVKVVEIGLHACGVVLNFGVQAGFSFMDKMTMMLPFDQAFE